MINKSNINDEIMPWHEIIPEHEINLYKKAGFGHKGPTPKRPALIVIDVQYRSIGHTKAPIEESIKQYPTSCGEFGWNAIPQIAKLIEEFRRKKFPVVFAYVAQKGEHDGQRFADKAPSIMSIPKEGYELVQECAAKPGDILIPKHHPSAFFGTPLISYLTTLHVDGLVVTGTTTSGCVRATTVDGSSYGYPIIVPYDAVFDRSQASHAVNLFDINSKYANVMASNEVLNLYQ